MKDTVKTILIILENKPSPIGGIERHCYNIQQLFNDDPNLEIEILSKNDIKHKNIKVINKIIFSYKELKKKIISSNAGTVHIHGFASLVVFQAIVAASFAKKRIIYTPHFHPFSTLANPHLGKIFFQFLLKPYLKRIDTIISINKEDSSFFKRFHNKVITIPNWLNYIFPLSTVIEGKSFQNDRMILFVGRADANKGIDYLEKLSASEYEIHCVTKGHIHDGFIYHSSITEEVLSKLYYQAKLVIVPSRYEAFSYVALEALSHGTQILVSDRVRILDHLKGDHSLVHQFIYGNYEDFSNKINTIMSKRIKSNIIGNYDEIMLTFNKEKIKDAFKHVYWS